MREQKRVYYTPLELAEMFGVSRRTIYAWFASGLLPSVKAGPKLRYVTPQQLEQFLEASGRTAGKKVVSLEDMADGPMDLDTVVAGLIGDDVEIPDDVMTRMIESGAARSQSIPALVPMAPKRKRRR